MVYFYPTVPPLAQLRRSSVLRESYTSHVSKNFSFTSTVSKRKHHLHGEIFFHFILVPGTTTSFNFSSIKVTGNMVVEACWPSLTPSYSPSSVPRTPFSWRRTYSGWVIGAKATFWNSSNLFDLEQRCLQQNN